MDWNFSGVEPCSATATVEPAGVALALEGSLVFELAVLINETAEDEMEPDEPDPVIPGLGEPLGAGMLEPMDMSAFNALSGVGD